MERIRPRTGSLPASSSSSPAVPLQAAWQKANPKAIDPWLSGLTTLDGKPAADTAKSSLGL
ncbi:substrate-binding choline ABC transporter domain-containing protein [Rhizobium gallicum bv. gallicum R602sp]|uniref:Substrate-binding choline ABC transporter domain-containing protein n=1 Tax=Rhizobium gallicum bv. gallicum R602sp TaxID=1041138 RepID=A0A0B4WXM2_9HYPH|nr:substrate-binding choline ABC transporter domain-containing protein [Rhizobium gallicum bv. gallicum R602sp]